MQGSLLETRQAGSDPDVAIRTWLNLVDRFDMQKTKGLTHKRSSTPKKERSPGSAFWGLRRLSASPPRLFDQNSDSRKIGSLSC